MKIFHFDPEIGKDDGPFGSVKAIIAKVLQLDDSAEINAIYVHPDERLRVQQAITQQLFLLVDGTGWVENESGQQMMIGPGQAIFFGESELPELGTESGMTAVIIGNIDIEPLNLMPLLQEDNS